MAEEENQNTTPFIKSNAITLGYYFCKMHNWTATQVRLHKGLYIAHMIMLGEQGRPLLVGECFESWRQGPVIPSLYRFCQCNYDFNIKKETFEGRDCSRVDKDEASS